MSSERERGDRKDSEDVESTEEWTPSTPRGPARASVENSTDPDPAPIETATWDVSSAPQIVVEDDNLHSEDETEFVEISPPEIDATVAVGSTPNVAAVSSPALRPISLERIEPSLGRGERFRLDASCSKMSLGRGEKCDIRLYTTSASRDHAVISGDETGDWILTPSAGKSVSIDGGEPTTQPVVLDIGMNIILGQDHLRIVAEGLVRRDTAVRRSAVDSDDASDPRSRFGRWALGLAAAIGVGWILFALLRA